MSEAAVSKIDQERITKRSLFTHKTPTIDDLISSHAIPILAKCLAEHDRTTLQFQAACSVTKMICYISEQENQVRTAGVVPLFLKLLPSPRLNECERGAWALRDLICGSSELLHYIISSDYIKSIVSLVKVDGPTRMLRILTSVILKLCYIITNDMEQTLKTIPALTLLLDHTDSKILEDAVFSIMWLSSGPYNYVLYGMGVIKKLIPLLGHTEIQVQEGVLRTLKFVSQPSISRKYLMLEYDCCSYFPALLSHPVAEIRTLATGLFLELMCNNQPWKIAVAEVFSKIFENLSKDELQKLREATKVMGVLLQFNFEWISMENGIGSFCGLLNSDDDEVVNGTHKFSHLSYREFNVFEGIYQLFTRGFYDLYWTQVSKLIKECDGLKIIKKFQNHEDDEIRTKAEYIVNLLEAL